MTARSMTATVTQPRRPADIVLLVTVGFLAIFGLLMVFDASFPMSMASKVASTGQDPLYFGKTQAKCLIGGLLVMFITYRIGYKSLRRFAGVAALIGLVGLCTVWVPGIGITIQHSARWIHVFAKFQPSEFAKFAMVLFVASMLSRPDCNIRKFSQGVVAPFIVAGAYMILIDKEPDLGTALIVFAAFLTMLVVAGVKWEHLGALLAVVVLLFLAKGGLKQGQLKRVQIWELQGTSAKDDGYQTYHARLALGSGQVTGVGWGAGHEKFYLPEANSDFVFATVGEELGFVGTSLMILLFGAISWAGFTIARETKDTYGRLLATGITALITWQSIVNIAVVTISIPATGVPLPLISLGGTSLIITMASMGILLSIAHSSQGPRPAGPV